MATGWDGLINDLNRVIKNDRAIRTALTSVLPVHKKRIFDLGRDATGSIIGLYGINPISISKKNQARQTGHTYFKGGYAQYKKEIGKNPGFVNLRNTDQMQIDYGLMFLGNNAFGYGFTNSTNYKKSQWLQEKYDKDIFILSDVEKDLISDTMTKILFA